MAARAPPTARQALITVKPAVTMAAPVDPIIMAARITTEVSYLMAHTIAQAATTTVEARVTMAAVIARAATSTMVVLACLRISLGRTTKFGASSLVMDSSQAFNLTMHPKFTPATLTQASAPTSQAISTAISSKYGE